jgi:hypothetical protein
MIIWKDITENRPEDGKRVLLYLYRRDRIVDETWHDHLLEILHPSHWSEVVLPSEDIQARIQKIAASMRGKHRTERKSHAARENGKRGGRPKKKD